MSFPCQVVKSFMRCSLLPEHIGANIPAPFCSVAHTASHSAPVYLSRTMAKGKDVTMPKTGVSGSAAQVTLRRQKEKALLKAGALQKAIFNSANFSSIA